ncbi:MAG: GIY-YIG nuclease family protein [Sulfobacillus sp.]
MTMSLVGGVRHPKIYAYTIDQYVETAWIGGRKGNGLIKVGETQRDIDVRIREQLNAVKMPVSTRYSLLLAGSAVTDDGRVFTDKEVHRVLERAGVRNVDGEWYECTATEVEAAIESVRTGTNLPTLKPTVNFPMRPEQRQAVQLTASYFRAHSRDVEGNAPHFLWNAKMRFGKTFTSYQLAKEMGWTRVLVLTYKPAVEKAWRDDLESHNDFAGWRFKGREDGEPDLDNPAPLVWFASFQDVLGHDDKGQPKLKNEDLYLLDWDVVVIDEYHFGAWRDAARSLYLGDHDAGVEGDKSEEKIEATPDLEDGFVEDLEATLSLSVGHYLYLSGTPFRALTEGEFLEDQVYNWTYSDEQRAKENWTGPAANPYQALPQMHLLVYEMPEALKEVALNNMSEFSLTEFFRVEKDSKPPKFVHETEVQKWVDLLRGQDLTDLWASVSSTNRPPLPFEDVNLLTALQHTVWYLPSVDACVVMHDLLRKPHNKFFRDYEIVVAAGSKAGMGEKALEPVERAIGNVPQDSKSITLSCGKLMTGVTVPAWAGIFMLRELKSPESYFQAAFRVQSPWAYKYVDSEKGGVEEAVVKEHCYVLDFSPNRALRLMVDYATKLRTAATADTNEEAALDEFMEFLPVLSFTGYAMHHVRAGDVIDYLTKGISSSMLARRWNSPELITLDIKAMEAILADQDLLKSLEQIEMFRNIGNDLTALISTNKELRPKKLARGKLTPAEKKKKDEAAKKREGIKKKLQRFLTRIPAFMYLTDDREKTVYDIITQVEPDLFEKVTTLSLRDFGRLVNAGAFNASKMNDAVWKFRSFEEPSLRYTHREHRTTTRGGWNIRRDERFADLVEVGLLAVGDALKATDAVNSATAVVTDDYGLLIDGVRYESPDEAAEVASAGRVRDGWTYWSVRNDSVTLATLRESLTKE